MRQILTSLLLSIILVGISNVQAQSTRINPYLQTVLLDAANNEMIDVYATLKDQYSYEDLKQETAFLPKKRTTERSSENLERVCRD